MSDSLWDLVKDERTAKGFDRESYTYSLQHNQRLPQSNRFNASGVRHASKKTFLLKLEGPLESVKKVQEAAGLSQLPPLASGQGDMDDAMFCKLTASARDKLLVWLAVHHPSFRPITVKLSKAEKELDPHSLAPCPGLDTSLPQNRATSPVFGPLPRQDQYPVWYFFYGNLARSEELQQRLDLPEPPSYKDAKVFGGKLRSWRGQYRALVDGEPDDVVHGSAYLVQSKEHEEILQFHETEMYEAVRCGIYMKDQAELGLVFRFCGMEEELGR